MSRIYVVAPNYLQALHCLQEAGYSREDTRSTNPLVYLLIGIEALRGRNFDTDTPLYVVGNFPDFSLGVARYIHHLERQGRCLVKYGEKLPSRQQHMEEMKGNWDEVTELNIEKLESLLDRVKGREPHG